MNRKSYLWTFFEPDENGAVAVCNACKKNVSYRTSISNLKKHIERMHPVLPVIIKEETPCVMQLIPPPSPPQSMDTDGDHLIAAPAPSTARTTSGAAQIPDCHVRKRMPGAEKKKLRDSFLKLFYLDLQPFSMTEDRGFREFVRLLNPAFEIPGRKSVSDSLIPAAYAKCLANTKEVASNIKSICLTIDAWTSNNNESFIAVTGHFIDDAFLFKKILLKCVSSDEGHTTDILTDVLLNTITEWNLQNKVRLVVSDNAPNIVSAIKDKLKLPHLSCFTHMINLIVNDALVKTPNAPMLITKVKALVTLFKTSTVAQNKLIECQQNLGLKPKNLLQDVETKLNSTYNMLQRFAELEDAIGSAMVELVDSNAVHLSAIDWLTIKDLLKLLSPFEAATKCTSDEKYMTASMVIVVTNGLLDMCSALSNDFLSETANAVLEKLQEGVVGCLGNVEISKSLSCATFLDPRMKTQAFKSSAAAEAARADVISLVSAKIQQDLNVNGEPPVVPEQVEETPLTIFSSFKKKVAREGNCSRGTATSRAMLEVQRYIEDDFLQIEDDPAAWWGNNWRNYPYLCKVVQSKFCAVATSIPCERLQSKENNILNERRMRLSAKKDAQLLFLSENYQFLD